MMKYHSLNLTATKIAKNIAKIAKVYGISNNALFQVKHIQGLEQFGFIGVFVLYNNALVDSISVDTYNNQITDSKVALQYLSLRITKLIEKYADASYEDI